MSEVNVPFQVVLFISCVLLFTSRDQFYLHVSLLRVFFQFYNFSKFIKIKVNLYTPRNKQLFFQQFEIVGLDNVDFNSLPRMYEVLHP